MLAPSIFRRAPPHAPGAAALLSLLVSGCDGCHASKPYTPYTLSDPSAEASAAPTGAGVPPPPSPGGPAGASISNDGGPSFPAVQGIAPPGDGKSWPLEGNATVNAPVGRTFGVGLVLDVDGDGKRDLLAWARGPDGLRGELWFAPGKNPDGARTIAALPDGLSVPGCSARADLTQVGPRTLIFDFEPRCPLRARDKAIRWFAVLRLPAAEGAVPEIGMELRIAPPADGEALQIVVDPSDRDGDGRGDITAAVTLSGAPRPFPSGQTASATLAFFDRPAGLSRDPTEPEASLKALTAALVTDARRKTTATRVAPAAFNLRRLYTLLCEEGGKPLLTTTAGQVRCGETRLLEDTAMAETEAALNLGDPVAAMAGVARLDALGVHRKDIESLLAKNIPQIKATAVHKTTAAPQIEPSPAYSPLAFDSAGDLLVHAKDNVTRVDHASFNEATVDAAMRWPTKLAHPEADPAFQLTSVEQRCDEPTLIAHFEAPKAARTFDLPLPVSTPPRCTPAPRVSATLLGASSQGALFAVGAEVVAIPFLDSPKPAVADSFGIAGGTAVALGAARSPDGATIAIPTARGLLVVALKGLSRVATAKLWTGLDPGSASLCVPSNKGARVACAAASNATIYEAK